MSTTGLIFDIQRFSLFDGPGIRTTVFLKGCPLHCPWCHNPEGIAPRPELLFDPRLCIQCGACAAVCPQGAHTVEVGAPHTLDRSACIRCGTCTEACPSLALRMAGKPFAVSEVMAIVLRDAGYYADSGGGLTLSGGEPLLQPTFAAALLNAAKAAGLHTAIETSGAVGWRHLESVLPVTDLFLFDLKETDPERHDRIVGVPLAPILTNLRRLLDSGATVVLRLPMIPGYNDRPDHIAAVAELVRALPELSGVHLLPYHRLGEGKRALLGLPEARGAVPTPEPVHIAAWKAQFAEAGVTVRLPQE